MYGVGITLIVTFHYFSWRVSKVAPRIARHTLYSHALLCDTAYDAPINRSCKPAFTRLPATRIPQLRLFGDKLKGAGDGALWRVSLLSTCLPRSVYLRPSSPKWTFLSWISLIRLVFLPHRTNWEFLRNCVPRPSHNTDLSGVYHSFTRLAIFDKCQSCIPMQNCGTPATRPEVVAPNVIFASYECLFSW